MVIVLCGSRAPACADHLGVRAETLPGADRERYVLVDASPAAEAYVTAKPLPS